MIRLYNRVYNAISVVMTVESVGTTTKLDTLIFCCGETKPNLEKKEFILAYEWLKMYGMP